MCTLSHLSDFTEHGDEYGLLFQFGPQVQPVVYGNFTTKRYQLDGLRKVFASYVCNSQRTLFEVEGSLDGPRDSHCVDGNRG